MEDKNQSVDFVGRVMKIVINDCYGGFGLSEKALKLLGMPWFDYNIDRNRADARLIEVVEKIGHEANGPYAKLKVVEIPDGVEWEIEEYDGKEWVAEKHSVWR